MILGLRCGVVELAHHDLEWEVNAADTIKRLKDILGPIAKDIQHIGSTAIRHIRAKPVIDIAVAVWDFDEVLALSPSLDKEGFIFRGWEGSVEKQPIFQCGEYIPEEKNMRLLTHYIHIVLADSLQWYNYINFRDYLNAFPTVAFEYERLKLQLAQENKNDYHSYLKGKQKYIIEIIEAANQWSGL
ncbi:MAG: GrpB family protein [Bacillota bacterium]|nr:GrpB family protein [Bacillota bacterium]HHU61292.1 GrpB family protein [Natronincola sp.]